MKILSGEWALVTARRSSEMENQDQYSALTAYFPFVEGITQAIKTAERLGRHGDLLLPFFSAYAKNIFNAVMMGTFPDELSKSIAQQYRYTAAEFSQALMSTASTVDLVPEVSGIVEDIEEAAKLCFNVHGSGKQSSQR